MKTYNIDFATISQLQQKLEESSYKDSEKLLVQIFCAVADEKFIIQLQKLFQKKFPSARLIGATTDGVLEKNRVYHDSVSIANLTYFEDTLLDSALIQSELFQHDSKKCGFALMQQICKSETKAVITFSDGITTNGEEFVKGCSQYNKEILLAGGMAGDNGRVVRTYVFDKFQITSEGAVGVSLSSKNLFVTNYYSFDWLPVGRPMKVTKSYKNRVYKVEDVPAVDIYAKYLGKKAVEHLPKIGIDFPFLFEKNGVMIGRAVLQKHSDGSLTFAGNIDEGTDVRFGVGNIDIILQNNIYHLQKFSARLKRKPEVIFVYSCMARRRFFDQEIENEITMLSKLAPIAGFFTYGEFYHNENSNQLLNETMTLLSLSESCEEPEIDINFFEKLENHIKFTTEQGLAYLANKVSEEFTELNSKLQQKIDEKTQYIYRQAYYDRLTQLPNRLALIRDISENIGSILYLINVDDFSAINDLFGHTAGDRILLQMAAILKKIVDSSCKIYKLPSDEFAIIAPLKYSQSVIEDFANKIISKIEEQQFIIEGNQIYISVTVTGAYINQSGTGLRNADMTLRLARKENKKFLFYNEDLELTKQYEENLRKISLIKEAIKNDGVIPYFQPIVDTKSREIVKYESLVRLKSGDEIYSPAFFLQTSEKLKFYHDIMRQMVEKSFIIAQKHKIDFSINLSYSDLLDEDFQRYLFEMIRRYDVSKMLTVEILETQSIDYETNVRSFVSKIHDIGAKIAIDDFGSGYANFKHITSIECDYLKIDGSLIKDLDHDRDARLIVETIIVFAKKLGKKTVAEFVHSKEIFNIVKELGIDYAQGYYLGKPEPLD